MRAAGLLWRAEVRTHRRALVVLVLTVALGSAVSLASLAGARRTAGAHGELLESVNAFDLGISLNAYDPLTLPDRLEAIPGVAEASQHTGFFDIVSPDLPPDEPVFWFGPPDGQKTVDRPVVYEGRLGETVDELAVNTTLAERADLTVGDHLELVELDTTTGEPVGGREVEIVGIMGLPESVLEDEADANAIAYLSPAYVRRALDRHVWGQALLTVDPGADAAVARALAEQGFEQDQDQAGLRRQAQDSVRVLAVALTGLGLLAGAASVAVAVQWLLRLTRRDDGEELALDALGCRPGQRRLADLAVAATGAVPAVVLGGLLAAAASSLFPVGSLRAVPAVRGPSVDALVLLGGGGLLVGLVVVTTTAIAELGRRRTGRREPLAVPLGPLAALPTAAAGVRLAAASSRLGAYTGLVAALAAAVAAMTFTGSLDRLVDDPDRSGFTWDLMAKEAFTPLDHDAIEAVIAEAEGIERATGLGFTEARVAGRPQVLSVWTTFAGSPFPPVLDGEAPTGPFELLVGRRTLDDLDLQLGDRVPVEIFEFEDVFSSDPIGSVEQDFTVVGTVVAPAIGVGGTEVPRLDDGVAMAGADLARLLPEVRPSNLFLFELTDDVDPDDFRAEYFPDGLPDEFAFATEWLTSAQPSEVIEAASARPALAAATAALLLAVVATFGHALLGIARDRRRSYAVLSAVGFTPRQLRATILWQAAVGIVGAVVIAVPVGVVAGRWLWRAYATDIGVLPEPATPVTAIAMVVAATVLAALVAAQVPATRARRAGTVARDRDT